MNDATVIDPAFFPERPLEDRSKTFLTEQSGAWTGERLLGLAKAIDEAIGGKRRRTVGICSGSVSFILAGVLASWRRGSEPLLLDPNLKSEPALLFADEPEMPILVDSPRRELRNTVVVAAGSASNLHPVWPEAGQTAVKFFTSGSTGEPKVIVKRGFQLFSQMQEELAWLGFPNGLQLFAMVPPFHILGFVYGLLLPLLGRGSTTFLHGATPSAWIDHMEKTGPDVVVGVPSHYRFLVNSLEGRLPEAHYISSGAPLTPDIDRVFAEHTGQSIVQIYGSTETGGIAMRSGFGAWTPFPGLAFRIRPEDGRLMVLSAWQEEPTTWTITDDIAAADEDGGFQLLGRADSVVKVGGKRFSTNEILQIVEGMDAVDSAAVVTYKRFTEDAVALFVTASVDRDPTPEGLRGVLASRLAHFKVPRAIRVLKEMPLLASGKVDRQRLSGMAAAEEDGGAGRTA